MARGRLLAVVEPQPDAEPPAGSGHASQELVGDGEALRAEPLGDDAGPPGADLVQVAGLDAARAAPVARHLASEAQVVGGGDVAQEVVARVDGGLEGGHQRGGLDVERDLAVRLDHTCAVEAPGQSLRVARRPLGGGAHVSDRCCS